MLWDNIDIHLVRLVKYAQSASLGQIAGAVLVALIIASALTGDDKRNIPNIPTYYVSRLEPALLSHFKFVIDARSIISNGCRKFKNLPFIIRRFDADYNILPIKYLEEVHRMPPSIINGRAAVTQGLLYEWNDLHFLTRSDLHARVMNRKLAGGPELSKFLKVASEELDYGWELDVPQTNDWTEVDMNQIARMLVARMSARMFVGKPACRDPEWIKVTIEYTMNTVATAIILRMFPTWLRPVLAAILPFRYRQRRCRAKAEGVVSAKMKKLVETRRAKERGDPVPDEDETLLDWMIENGTKEETTVVEMANRQCALTLASIHTTSTNTAAFLFELCEHPEWVPVLREEINQVKEQMGGSELDYRRWHTKLEKMDSFLLECFRVHPPVLLSPQRVALEACTLKDGTHIPKGCTIVFTSAEHQEDPNITPDPSTFDPMRSYRKRYSSPDHHSRHQAAITDIDDNLTFGYGSQACPGRFLAVIEIKMLLARLLTEFDFKYPPGKSLPKTMSGDENVFLDPSARLMMKKREVPTN